MKVLLILLVSLVLNASECKTKFMIYSEAGNKCIDVNIPFEYFKACKDKRLSKEVCGKYYGIGGMTVLNSVKYKGVNRYKIISKANKKVMSKMKYEDDDKLYPEYVKDNYDHFKSFSKELNNIFLGDCDNAAFTISDLISSKVKNKEDIAVGFVFVLNEEGRPIYGHVVSLLRYKNKKDCYVADINLRKYNIGAEKEIEKQLDFEYMLKNGYISIFISKSGHDLTYNGILIENNNKSFLDEEYRFKVQFLIDYKGRFITKRNAEKLGWGFLSFI